MSFLYSLRLGRWGLAGFGALAFMFTILQSAGFYLVAGHTPQERAAFGRSMTVLAAQFTVLIAPPIRPDTVGGYVQWRAYGPLAIVFAFWALASAVGALRGDEERGLVETMLAAGVSRADAVVYRFGGFAAASMVAAIAGGAGTVVGVAGAHDSIDLASVAGETVVLVGLALSCYSVTLLVCQLASARIAAAASGIVLLALFLLNSLSRNLDWLVPWRWLSPFHYFDLSQPLSPSGTVDVRATEVLYAIAVLGCLAAAIAFSYRDLGGPLVRLPAPPRPASRDASGSLLWRIAVLRGVYDRRLGVAVWSAGVAALGAISVALTKSIVEPLLGLAQLRPYFNVIVEGGIYPSFLGFVWFGLAQLLVAAYAINQVARWAAEDADGRLEAALSSPVSRTAVVAERGAVLLLSSLLIVAVSGAAVAVESRFQSLDLDSRHLISATLLLVPFALFFAAIGSLFAAAIPRATAPVLGAAAFASYFAVQLGPIFRWPTWLVNLSPFHLYGRPLTSGVDAGGLAVMIAVVFIGFAASAYVMQRRDIAA